MCDEIVNIENVAFSYNKKKNILKDVSFKLRRGEIAVLAGPNGSGKTTLIKLIFDLLAIQKGSITINDKLNTNIEAKRNILYLPSDNLLPEFLTGNEYIKLMCNMYDVATNKELLERLIKYYSMETSMDDLIEAYSHGMSKKLQLILAFLIQPSLIIIDETLNGIDIEAKEITKIIMKKIVNKGCSILICSHDLELSEEIGERAILMYKGEIIREIIMEDLDTNETLSSVFKEIINFEEKNYDI